MIGYLKGSVIVGFFINIVKAFVRSYNSSVFKIVVDNVCLMCRESFLGRALNRYIYKKPFYENSVTYRLIMAIAGFADRIFGWLNKAIGGCIEGSAVINNFKAMLGGRLATAFFAAGIVLMSAPIGSLFALAVKNNANNASIMICVAVFAIGAVMSFLSMFSKVVENCFIVRAVKWFIDALK